MALIRDPICTKPTIARSTIKSCRFPISVLMRMRMYLHDAHIDHFQVPLKLNAFAVAQCRSKISRLLQYVAEIIIIAVLELG